MVFEVFVKEFCSEVYSVESHLDRGDDSSTSLEDDKSKTMVGEILMELEESPVTLIYRNLNLVNITNPIINEIINRRLENVANHTPTFVRETAEIVSAIVASWLAKSTTFEVPSKAVRLEEKEEVRDFSGSSEETLYCINKNVVKGVPFVKDQAVIGESEAASSTMGAKTGVEVNDCAKDVLSDETLYRINDSVVDISRFTEQNGLVAEAGVRT
ncbi:hypothetical protein PIB30_045254 [Stylosanthes scabra]|uniref:Uncharacterized protein n=1 Tax=Stylosanthes scabra TaxID=79078 RepID=A0ABU6YII0_9FABA|nr:hypothetical protein [Stylosanthes scabra]